MGNAHKKCVTVQHLPTRSWKAIEGGSTSPLILLTIAGLDPTSGAGLTADLKVFAAHGMYGIAAATALTVQSTAAVERVQPVGSALLRETLTCLAADLPVNGVKIGMLATAANVEVAASFLLNLQSQSGVALPIVLDPILRSTSGHALLEPDAVAAMRSLLLPLVTCVTPNTDELFVLNGEFAEGISADGMRLAPGELAVSAAAQLLSEHYPSLAIIATGGHLENLRDYVLAPGKLAAWIDGRRVETRATHGTGCAYSSALLCGLVRGLAVQQAALAAKQYVTAALEAATPIGAGGGSMHHLYAAFSNSLRG